MWQSWLRARFEGDLPIPILSAWVLFSFYFRIAVKKSEKLVNITKNFEQVGSCPGIKASKVSNPMRRFFQLTLVSWSVLTEYRIVFFGVPFLIDFRTELGSASIVPALGSVSDRHSSRTGFCLIDFSALGFVSDRHSSRTGFCLIDFSALGFVSDRHSSRTGFCLRKIRSAVCFSTEFRAELGSSSVEIGSLLVGSNLRNFVGSSVLKQNPEGFFGFTGYV